MKKVSLILLAFCATLTVTVWAASAEGVPTAGMVLYTATDADDFAAKLADMVWDDGVLLSAQTDAFSEYAASRLLIRASELPAGMKNYSLKETLTDGNGFYVVEFDSPENAKNCKDYLDTQSSVQYAEPDRVIALGPIDESGTPLLPNDPLLSWGVSGTKMDVFAALLKEKGLSSRIVVAVVDTGADTSHSSLSGRMTDGYNLIENNEPMRDGNGHGTHVSGTIAEATKGLDISIMPVRVMCDAGWGYSSVIGLGIKQAADKGANVINLSLGGGHSSYMDEAIAYAIGKNITVVSAAGNSNADTKDACPAHIQDGITVAAVDSAWKRASFSNHGDAVDIAAPGVSIGSCIPGEKYASWSGTSMAAPHVSAAAALLLYQTPALTPKQVETELRGAAVDRGDAGWDKEYGAGTLSMQKWIPGGTLVREGKFGENDSLTWSQYSDGALIISGQGAMPDYTDKEHAPWYEYRAGIKKVVIESGVTNIGNYAFENYGDLIDITISDTVLSIGKRAFAKCSSLESVAIPDSVITIVGSAFNTCSNLSALTLGEGLVTIGAHAFGACEKLTEVTLPDSLTSVEYAAFAACHGLTAFKTGANTRYTVVDGVLFSKDLKTLVIYPAGKGASYVVPEGTTTIGTCAFEFAANVTSVALPNSLTSIGQFAFKNTSLTSINFPNGLTSIGSYAFEECKLLTSVRFPDSLRTTGFHSFNACSSLSEIVFPDTLTSIDASFLGCSVTSVFIPASVSNIATAAFLGCQNLKEFQVDSNNANFRAVNGVLYSKDMTQFLLYPLGQADDEYTVPDGVSVIGTNAFYDCKTLKSIHLPDSVTSIRVSPFFNCTNLQSIYLPGSLSNIGERAFQNCVALKNIYYAGSAEQWEMVEIADGNDTLNKATVHYSQITVGSAEARPGENVEIPITMERTPGLTVMRLQVSYDSSVLTLESVEDGNILGSKAHSDNYSLNPYTLFWNNHTAKTNFTADGTIATLKFKVAPGAADGDYPISVSYDSAANDILNKDLRPVSFDLASGGVSVTHIRYGDVNDDKKVTPEDSAILDRYLAKWSAYQIINAENADVDTEPPVTARDSAVLARHLASWKGYETLPYAVPANASLMSGDTGVIKVETVRGEPGETVSVGISLKDNPGLTMMRLYVAYDGDALELQEVRDAGILGTEVHSDNYALNPYPLFWNNGTKKENFTVNGTIATLLFRIKDGAEAGGYPVTITHDAEKGDILDCDLHPVAFAATGGNVMAGLPPVTILDAKMFPSSVNSDGKGVTATVSNAIPGDTIWCNAYTESGKWIAAWSQEAVAGQTDYDFLPDKDFDYVKIFVLDAKLRPLCAYAKQ